MGGRSGTLAAAVGAALLVVTGAGAAGAAPALGQVVSTNPVNYTPNINQGAVYKSAEVNGMLFAGGSFTTVTAAAGTTPAGTFSRSHIVAFNAATGSISTSFTPSINGNVWAIVASGGSLYVGGTFSTVNGVARRGIVKLNPTTGAVDQAFNARLTGNVSEAAVVNGRLIISGTFSKKIAALNLATGADTGYINIPIAGSVATNAGPVEVYRFAVDPAGTRLVGIGNFTTVGGQPRVRALMLTLGATSATVNAWRYRPLEVACSAPKLQDQVRDVDFSPDGSYFVIVATGGTPRSGQGGVGICDAAARFETDVAAPARPTWINYTGGDTLHSVAVSDKAVYVQGHQRWLDNPQGHDNAGPGAVSRPGIGAIDPNTGLALPWNPTRARGVGAQALVATSAGLIVGSDTTQLGHEYHARLGMFPLS